MLLSILGLPSLHSNEMCAYFWEHHNKHLGHPYPSVHCSRCSLPPLQMVEDHLLQHPNWDQATLNQVHNQAHCIVQHAFSQLEAWWRCLASKLPVQEKTLASVTSSHVTLHSMCKECGPGLLFLPDLPPPVHVSGACEFLAIRPAN